MSDENPHSASQDAIWDLKMESISDFTNTALLHMIPVHHSPSGNSGSHCTSLSSALSSAPSGLLTPTIGTTTGERYYSTQSERNIYKRRRKLRKSWVYFRENGSEYTTADGKTRWHCARCKYLSFPSSFSPRMPSKILSCSFTSRS